MTNKYTGGFAFPQHTMEPNPNGGEPRIIWQEGMTLRDYFAAKAMSIVMPPVLEEIRKRKISDADVDKLKRVSADACYGMADAMMGARND